MYSLYRHLSPYFKVIARNLGLSPGSCRYHPTCSLYVKQAYSRHHFFYATWLSVIRLLKCHPWSRGGNDLVPRATTRLT